MRSDSDEQPAADHVDEVGDVDVDRAVGALGVIRRLGLRRHVAAGDPGRLEPGEVVVGVEVAVGGVPRVAGFRRPHPVADLQVAPEGDHVGVADRPAQCGVAVQRRAVDHEVSDSCRGVVVFHSRGVGAFGRPDPGRGVGQPLRARRPGLRAARTRAAAGRAAAGTDGPAGRRAAPPCRRRSGRAATGCRRAATGWRSRRAPGPPRRIRESRRPATLPVCTPDSRPTSTRGRSARWPPRPPAAASWPASGACRRGSTGRRAGRSPPA